MKLTSKGRYAVMALVDLARFDNINPVSLRDISLRRGISLDYLEQIFSKLRKKEIHKKMGWCDDPKSKDYNKLIKLPTNYSYEKLYRRENIYDLILVLNFNMRPIVKKKGSAIFIHIAKKKYKKTEGCVAVNKVSLLKIIKKLKNNTKVLIENQK